MRAVGIGAGGHAKVVLESLQARSDVEVVGLLDADRDMKGKEVLGVPVLGGDELLDDGEAEAGASLLGGEVGEEEALSHLVGEAGAGVCDDELDVSDRAGAGGEEAGGDVELAEEAVLHGLGGIVDEVGESSFEGFGVGEDEGQVGCEVAADADGAEAAGEECEGVFDDGVEVRGMGPGAGELGESGELVDERAHGFDRGGDDFSPANCRQERGRVIDAERRVPKDNLT